MAQTPLTSATSYATNTDMTNRYDVRTLGDLLNDDDTRPRLSPSEVLASTKLTALSLQSSGEFEAACVAGNRYLPADIAAIISNAGAAKEFVVGLVCALNVGHLFDRRFNLEMPKVAVQARETIELLRQGQRILPTQEAADAGMEVPQLDTSYALPDGRNLVIQEARRYLGPLQRLQ